jgi:hypothetical protein
MSLLISNKGNINGIVPERENSIQYVQEALDLGFLVVVDVFLIGQNQVATGCEVPQYSTTVEFLKNTNIICRAQSIECLEFLLSNQVHCFYHKHDRCSLTNGGLLWTRPGSNITKSCVFNLPEIIMPDVTTIKDIECVGICSNFIKLIKDARNLE